MSAPGLITSEPPVFLLDGRPDLALAAEQGRRFRDAATFAASTGCPPWCNGRCQRFEATREVVHEAEVFDLTLRLYPAAAVVRGRVVVAVVRIDEFAPDGTLLASSGSAAVVVDGPEGVTSLTAAESARLGAALIRAARDAR